MSLFRKPADLLSTVKGLLTAATIWALAGLPSGAFAQESVTLSPAQMNVLTAQMLEGGQIGQANQLADLLEQSQPTDARTWMLIATTRMAAADFDRAARAAAQAFRFSTTPNAKVQAARLAAAARFRQERFFMAEYWLRAARQNATSPEAVRAVAADYQGLERANPWDVRLTASIAPNSNINNGSDEDTIYIWGLPFRLNADARPLSGWEYSAGVNISRKVSESADHLTRIGLNTFVRSFTLSESAKTKAPDVEGTDYAFAVAEVFWSRNWRHKLANGPASATVTFGKNWYGLEPYTRYARVALSQEIRSPDGQMFNAGLTIQRMVDDRAGGVYSTTWTLNGGNANRLGNGNQLTTNIAFEKTQSETDSLENTALRTNLRYSFARPVAGMGLALSAGYEHRTWPVSIYALNGRKDNTLNIGADATLNGINMYGFSPVLSFEARRTVSNVSLYSRTSYGVRLGLETRF
jgi:hypothetical protein